MLCGEVKTDTESENSDREMESSLMECGICWEIVHPTCLERKHPQLAEVTGIVNEDLPNSWECPKCCDDGKQGQLKVSGVS